MKTKGKHTHRGEALKAAVKKTRTKVTQLVKRMGISRGTYYNHREDPNLPFEEMERYGKAIGYDFTSDFPEMQKYTVEEAIEPYGDPKTLGEALKQRDYWKKEADQWKNKYIQLLEEMKGK